MKLSVPLAPCVTLLLLTGSCNRHRESGTSETHVTSSRVSSPATRSSSVEAIATARCDREAHCDNLGDHGVYASRDACLNEVRAQVHFDMTETCPSGMNRTKVAACLNQIASVGCANTLEQGGHLAACGIEVLCGP